MFAKLKDNWRSVVLAVSLHLLIIALLIFGVQLVSNSSSKGNHGQRIVEATVSNPQAVDTEMPEAVSPSAEEKQPEPAPPEESQSQDDNKAQAARQKAEEQAARDQAKREAAEQKKAKAEAQREAREKARAKAEAERKAQEKAEAKRQAAAEAAQKKAEAQRKAREEAERKAKEEAQREAREEAERKAQEQARREAREEAEREKAAAAQKARAQALKDAMAQESAGRPNAADQRALGRWIQAITDKVTARWRRPPGAHDISCDAQVTQLPNGDVTNVKLLGSCGSPAVDRSVEQAIRRASPLPKAPSSDLFDKTINFHFEPDQ